MLVYAPIVTCTVHLSGRGVTVVVVAAGERREAVRSGPARTAAAEEWWPDWPEQYAYQHGGPPYPV